MVQGGRSAAAIIRFGCLMAVWTLSSVAVAACVSAGRQAAYAPVFARASAVTQARGSLKGDFDWAASSATLADAASRWQRFLDTYASADEEYEDGFQALHVEAARYELMRVYYLLGRGTDADRILEQLDPLELGADPP